MKLALTFVVLLLAVGCSRKDYEYTLEVTCDPVPVPGAAPGLVQALGAPAKVTLTWENGTKTVEFPSFDTTRTMQVIVINSGIDGDAFKGFNVEVTKEGYKSWSHYYGSSDFVWEQGVMTGRRFDVLHLEPKASADLSNLVAGG